MSRSVTVYAPGGKGRVPDPVSYTLDPQNVTDGQDYVIRNRIPRKRRGWVRDGDQVTAANLRGVWRAKFALAGVTRTLVTDPAGTVWMHNTSGAGLGLGTPPGIGIPRCMYRDELIFCPGTGQDPIFRYSGFGAASAGSTGSGAYTAGQSIYTLTTLTNPAAGCYVGINNITGATEFMPLLHVRALEATATTYTLESIRASVGGTTSVSAAPLWLGLYSWPAVVVYNAGTLSIAGGAAPQTVTGVGVKWSTGAWGSVGNLVDALMILPAGLPARMLVISTHTDTTMQVISSTAPTNIPYAITRPPPFTDACVHKDSLHGTGVIQHPNTVYSGPPGWNLALPPGAIEPFDYTVPFTSDAPSRDFLMATTDVPGPFDGDPNVALLPCGGFLAVLKRRGIYGMFGDWPAYDVVPLESGIGCIDRMSAIAVDEGRFFASHQGVCAIVGQSVENLMRGTMEYEWRTLVNEGVDYCAMGIADGHLIVNLVTLAGTKRCFAYDLTLGIWVSRFTNVAARAMHSARISGEIERLLWVGDQWQGRVMDLRPSIAGRKPNSTFTQATALADPLDADGVAPVFDMTLPSAVVSADHGIEGEVLVADVDVHANLVDSGPAGASQLTPKLTTEGGLQNPGQLTKVLDPILSSSVDGARRYARTHVNRRGRQASLRLQETQSGAGQSKLEIAQVVFEVEDLGPGT